MMAVSDDITYRIVNRVGRITLTRPKALNALTYAMALAIEAALDDWVEGDEVDLVLIDGEGDRAFCAGGDIRQLYDTGKAGDFSYGRKFWADEYRLNAKIANLPFPYVAIMDGITMGGGVGISAHGSDRIVTERSMIAMPECAYRPGAGCGREFHPVAGTGAFGRISGNDRLSHGTGGCGAGRLRR